MGDTDMNERDDNQELYEIHYVFQEGSEDKIYYIVARTLINAIDRFYKLQPTNKIRLIRLLAERDIGRFSMRTNLTVCADKGSGDRSTCLTVSPDTREAGLSRFSAGADLLLPTVRTTGPAVLSLQV